MLQPLSAQVVCSNSHFGKNRRQKASKYSIAHEKLGFLGTQICKIAIIILIMRIAGLFGLSASQFRTSSEVLPNLLADKGRSPSFHHDEQDSDPERKP